MSGETTVGEKLKLELISRGSKYPIWPQVWIIPYHGHVPVTPPWRTLVTFPASRVSTLAPLSPLLTWWRWQQLTWADGQGPLSETSKQGERQYWHGYAHHHQEKLPKHPYWGILAWPSEDILFSSSLCCMGWCRGGWGLDRAGVQDLIISDQVWERSWCWPIRSLPQVPWPMRGEDRQEGSWLFL